MRNVIFTKRPEQIRLSPGKSVCIYHKQYKTRLPQVEDCEFVEFDHLCKTFQEHDYMAGKVAIVFVGINKMFNSSTRIHPVFDLLQYGIPNLQKYAIDTAPYMGPIWRIWPQFNLAGIKTGDYTYSFLLESHYNGYLEGMRENPVSYETIRVWSENAISIDYNQYFADPEIEIINLDEETHAKYQQLKSNLFDEYLDINKIIKGLSDFAKAACKRRSIPQEHKMFETPENVLIVRTNLKVDEYLTNKLLNKIQEVNEVVKVLQ